MTHFALPKLVGRMARSYSAVVVADDAGGGSLSGAAAIFDHRQLAEEGAHIVPMGAGPALPAPFTRGFLGQVFEQFVRRADDVVNDGGAIGQVGREHGEEGERHHLVGEQPPVQIVDVVGLGAQSALLGLKAAIKAQLHGRRP